MTGKTCDVLFKSTIMRPKKFVTCFSLQFPNGILFPDIIEVNFSLTVDYHLRRPPGPREHKSSIMVAITTIHYIIHSRTAIRFHMVSGIIGIQEL